MGPGKESTTGHWELMGVRVDRALPTYPEGFPAVVVAALEQATGQRFCCNRPFSGTAVLDEYGEHHLRTGELILYTSADSVLQIAAHVDVLSEPELYRVCASAREVMTGEHAVGRVIARPFDGAAGAWRRREGRRDFALPPPSRSYLEELQAAGVPVHGVGKIRDLFAGVGVDVKHPGATNAEGIAATTALLRELDDGLRLRQPRGDRPALRPPPRRAPALPRRCARSTRRWRSGCRCWATSDLLVLTADHGVDPTTNHTDHTREYAPLLARFEGHGGRRHDGALADVGASVMRWLTGRDAPELPGTSFV